MMLSLHIFFNLLNFFKKKKRKWKRIFDAQVVKRSQKGNKKWSVVLQANLTCAKKTPFTSTTT
jgi:hypothetical protein